MKSSKIFSKIKHLFYPHPQIGGLEISMSGARLFLLNSKSKMVNASVPLLPGAIGDGEVRQKEQVLSALSSLHKKISPLNRPLNVVLSIPSQLVYTQSFSVPLVSKKHLDEAIELNLQTISPTRIEEAFYDWQHLKEGSDAKHFDLLGAFAPAKAVKQYLALAKEAGFNVVSVEFPALSLSRLIKERWEGLDTEKHYLCVYLNNEGILFLILKNGNLSFSQFVSWQQALGEEKSLEKISFSDIKASFSNQLKRILNYYFGRTSQNLNDAILVSPFFNYEIVELAKNEFDLNIRNLSFKDDIQAYWFVALGAALRGLVARSHDEQISLMETNTQAEYYRERVFVFIRSWRNIISAVLFTVLLSAAIIDTVLYKEQSRLLSESATQLAEESIKEIESLRESANRFNTLLSLVEKAASQEVGVSGQIIELKALAGSGISFDRLVLDKNNATALISGKATNELTAINFKNRLARHKDVESVTLPLSNIKTIDENSVSFVLNLAFKKDSSE